MVSRTGISLESLNGGSQYDIDEDMIEVKMTFNVNVTQIKNDVLSTVQSRIPS